VGGLLVTGRNNAVGGYDGRAKPQA